ncbi:putative holin-like toxin [Lactococcus petauri]|nr:putative holin-like toxin [Lactococcus petauri]
MSTYETLTLMIAFALLVLKVYDKDNKKKRPTLAR